MLYYKNYHNQLFYDNGTYDYLLFLKKLKSWKENERGTRSKKKSKGVARKNLSRWHSVNRGK
jgi:hypothetical protein